MACADFCGPSFINCIRLIQPDYRDTPRATPPTEQRQFRVASTDLTRISAAKQKTWMPAENRHAHPLRPSCAIHLLDDSEPRAYIFLRRPLVLFNFLLSLDAA